MFRVAARARAGQASIKTKARQRKITGIRGFTGFLLRSVRQQGSGESQAGADGNFNTQSLSALSGKTRRSFAASSSHPPKLLGE